MSEYFVLKYCVRITSVIIQSFKTLKECIILQTVAELLVSLYSVRIPSVDIHCQKTWCHNTVSENYRVVSKKKLRDVVQQEREVAIFKQVFIK